MYITAPINVVLALDKSDLEKASVLLKSLCCYQRNLAIFILSNEDLDETFKLEVTHALKHQIIDIKFFKLTVPDNFKSKAYISESTYLRYALEDLFEYGHSDYWLYLDCDTLVVRNILEPFTWEEFEQYPLAAVPDTDVKNIPEHVQKFGEDDYFNAGVLYINAKKWKDYKQRLITTTILYADELKFAEQDVFNLTFKQQWLKLPIHYNTQLNKQEGEDNQRAAILHFTGSKKPYNLDIEQNPDYPNLERYQYYQQKTWQEVLKPKTVAVITSTIGRAELERAIVSVQQQTYPCKHYVFVDGEQYFDKVKALALQEKYPNVIFTFLPMNTGAGGWTNSSINAIAPFLVKEDILCYLDDDNWYEHHHIQSIIDGFNSYADVEVVYNLRRLMKEDGEFLCNDNVESLGFWGFKKIVYNVSFNKVDEILHSYIHRTGHVDTNCIAMTKQVAQELSPFWIKAKNNDYMVFQQCLKQKKVMVSTGQRTVNYILNIENNNFVDVFEKFKVEETQKLEFKYLIFFEQNRQVLEQIPEIQDWFQPTVFINGKLLSLK